MFSYDSKFNQTVNQIIDCIFLSLLWVVSSLPLFTIGASTTAMYHTVDTVFRKNEGSIWKEFWRVFRRDFKRATVLWFIMVLMITVLAFNFYAAFYAGIANEMLQIGLQIGATFLIAIAMIWLQFWFPYLSRFDDPIKVILKNTMAIMMAETKVAIRLLLLLLLVVALDAVLSMYVPVLTILIPVAYISVLNKILEQLFARYISQQEAAKVDSNEEIGCV